MQLGYALSSEEHRPGDLVRWARRAEEAGFEFGMISDHYHPWTDRQGNSPFAWSVLGALAEATERMSFGTAVTCPLIRYHPVLVAQMAATVGAMMPGRFWLGLGTGENLNEHVYGDRWPGAVERISMFREAIQVIRALWQGDLVEYDGDYYGVSRARVYTLPGEPVPIFVAGNGPKVLEAVADLADGYIGTAPKKDLLATFDRLAGTGKPKIGQLTVCWASDEAVARATAFEIWPTAALTGEASQELPLPRHFEELAKMVTEEMVAKQVVCGPDVERHVEAVREYLDAGYDRVYVHQIGPEQDGMIDFYGREVLPRLERASDQVPAGAG
ncbi:MAG TPA: TIGR03557 family F420-dependent LLM class oxidoreductase [Candidatus Limnocylindrales bacterium]|nr:TIGR03557 family F420-dependent LLM class oxidoreductase [Candidatus Limnocylindrales bacterium]